MDIREDLNIYMQIIRLLDESVNGYLYACDLQDDRMYFTDKICRRFALPFSGEQGIPFKEWEAVIYDRDVKLIKDDMEAVRSGKRNGCDIECRMIDREGNRVGVHWRATVHADKSGKPAVLLGSMDELVLGQRIDSLTGLWNYDKCTEDLESAVLKEEGYFIVFGIDNFKHINDNHGHDIGDIVLQSIAQTVLSCVRKTDAVIRYGGDEFVIIFFNIPQDIFEKKLERIRHSVDSLIIDDRPVLHMSISIGGAYGIGTIKKLFKAADNMMYQSKKAKNQVTICYFDRNEDNTDNI